MHIPPGWRPPTLRINLAALPPLPDLPKWCSDGSFAHSTRYIRAHQPRSDDVRSSRRRASPLTVPSLETFRYIGDAFLNLLIKSNLRHLPVPSYACDCVSPKIAAGLLVSNDNLSYISRHYALERFYRGPPAHHPSGEQHLQADLLEAYVGVFWDALEASGKVSPSTTDPIEQYLLRHKMETYAKKLVSLDVFPDLWEQVMFLYEHQKGNTPWRASRTTSQPNVAGKPEEHVPRTHL